jgi:hypothetical protein
MDQISIKNLKIDEEEVDGIHFHISGESEKQYEWNFTIMKLNEEEDRNFEKHEMGYKYQIVLYEDDDKTDYFEAILGDLQHYVKKMVNINTEGFILKKSKKSDEILKRIFKGKLLGVLAQVADSKG